jgi:predicted kinase
VVVTGRPGSGKTTLARRLSEQLHLPMVSRDELKEGYVSTFGVSHEALPADTNRSLTSLFFSVTRMLLEARISLIVEAAFQHRVWEEAIVPWSAIGEVRLVICEADSALCAKRLVYRGLADPSRVFFHGDNAVKSFQKTGELPEPASYIAPSFDVPTLRVSTTEGYSPELATIGHFAVHQEVI